MKVNIGHNILVRRAKNMPGFVAYVDGYKVGASNVSYIAAEDARSAAQRFIHKWRSHGLNAALRMQT